MKQHWMELNNYTSPVVSLLFKYNDRSDTFGIQWDIDIVTVWRDWYPPHHLSFFSSKLIHVVYAQNTSRSTRWLADDTKKSLVIRNVWKEMAKLLSLQEMMKCCRCERQRCCARFLRCFFLGTLLEVTLISLLECNWINFSESLLQTQVRRSRTLYSYIF
jgi:hypothetical protein